MLWWCRFSLATVAPWHSACQYCLTHTACKHHEPDLDSSLCEDDELFLRFEPPISSQDYLYGLEPDEGLGDLFGSSFI